MAHLLGILSIILALVLFPPAALAVVSNNAVPGDTAYPIKRILEDGIYAIASLNPITRAWFSAARSDRRYKEFSTLVTQGKSASNTLNELVAQTDIAAEEIKRIDDPVRKQQLITQLSQSIDKYSQKLDEVTQQESTQPLESAPATNPTETKAPSTPSVVTPIVSSPAPITNIKPRETASPTETVAPTAKPTSTPRPIESPRPSSPQILPPSSPQPPSTAPINPGEADDAKKKFEDIKKKLEGQINKDSVMS